MWFNSPARRPDWSIAQEHLRAADPVMRRIIDAVGPCTMHPRRDYFVVLCQSIFNQQLSIAAAATLFNRFRDQFPLRRPTPGRVIEFLASGHEPTIRACGLSRQKQAYVLDLARHFNNAQIPTAKLNRMSDEAIIESLTRVRGIGQWTAEMFLMFVLNRPDVLPVDDLGLKQGMQQAYGLRKPPTAERMRTIAEAWRPWRSVGTWYIWRRPRELKRAKMITKARGSAA
jgi:DNA-3-methyladenine glycosylase II